MVTSAVLAVAVSAALGAVLHGMGAGTYEKDCLVAAMRLLRAPTVQTTVLRQLPAEPLPSPHEGAALLDAIRARGFIRVGCVDGAMLYSYFNSNGELVGFDVEMAYRLAEGLGLKIEFVPVPRERLAEVVNSGMCDVLMAGIAVTAERASAMLFAPPYIDETFSFVVPDKRNDFSSAAWIRATSGLRVGVPGLPNLRGTVRFQFPGVEIVPVSAEQIAHFFAGRGEPVDGLVLPVERASYFTLLHPAFAVAVPHPLKIQFPLAYPVARHDLEFARFLGIWIDLQRKNGTIQTLCDHWILGQDARPQQPRWSIIRNVLHWVK
jgi:ABC-type amino acid transport substrate-binding protein